jgi:uncharacterized peroxidase-related enzyme
VASHHGDLRSEVGSEELALAVQGDYRTAGLDGREVALLDYAVKLTMEPPAVAASDIERLRRFGYPDEQIVDAVHCIGYFNFINRVLDGLGVDAEPSMGYAPQGADALGTSSAPQKNGSYRG